MTDTVMDHLTRVSIFAHFHPEELAHVAGLAKDADYGPGEVIIREGAQDGRLFIIISGRVEVVKNLDSKRHKTLQVLGPDSYFGEMALLDGSVRSASVVAVTRTRVVYIEHLNLLSEIQKYPRLAVELLQLMVRRIRALEKSMLHTLGELLPICANCKKIRESNGQWTAVDAYIADHSDSDFSHGICPECARSLYPGIDLDTPARREP